MSCYYLQEEENNKELLIDNIFISNEDYKAGNPYNTTFRVKVKSGYFAGAGDFELDIADFCTFSKELFNLYNNLSGKVSLNDVGHGSFLQFEAIDKIGHIQICGEIYGEAQSQVVKFAYEIDQTELQEFSKNLYEDFGSSDTYKRKAKFNQS